MRIERYGGNSGTIPYTGDIALQIENSGGVSSDYRLGASANISGDDAVLRETKLDIRSRRRNFAYSWRR